MLAEYQLVTGFLVQPMLVFNFHSLPVEAAM